MRDTERVLQCQVLRCQERATRNFVIGQAEWGLFETIVCEVHAAALEAGERYVYNSVENVIYMGQDTPPPNKQLALRGADEDDRHFARLGVHRWIVPR